MGLSICYQLAASGRSEEIGQRMSDWQAQLKRHLPGCKISELAVTDKQVWFDLLPGPGTEIARMRLRNEESELWTGSWDCKTQYAGCAQYGGPANFLEAHGCLIKALDIGYSSGLVETVSDDGGYWSRRSIEKLLERFHAYQSLVASLVAQVRDAGFSATSPQDEPESVRQERSTATIDSI
ncbi:MAG: hypothetical protein IH623_11200 [Verrucomicrobia bacterium]|nr:hypothetical protein [Verrucomicrobiota bacterium]